jgi:hypothetical protein
VVWPQNHSDDFCRFGLKTGGDGFSSVWASKPMVTVFEWFDLKTTRTVFTGLASKPMVTVPTGLASKPTAMVFTGLASKPVVTVWPQNLLRWFLAVWPQICCDGFCWFGLKTSGDGF